MSSGENERADGAGGLLAGRYRIVARLGRGGMGVVWRAVDEVLDREVAVKELRTYSDAGGTELASLGPRMRREARAAARVRHPGVIAVHDVAQVDGRPLIVMELIDGPSLDDVLRERGTLDPREAASIGAEVMDALAAAHRVGVLHRDVKPGNILLDRSGRVVLTDFGIATMEDPGDGSATHLTRSGELVGSLDYLAPERAQGDDPGPASDVWSLGATLYAAVEGSSPFRRTSTWSTLNAIVIEPLPEPVRAGPPPRPAPPDGQAARVPPGRGPGARTAGGRRPLARRGRADEGAARSRDTSARGDAARRRGPTTGVRSGGAGARRTRAPVAPPGYGPPQQGAAGFGPPAPVPPAAPALPASPPPDDTGAAAGTDSAPRRPTGRALLAAAAVAAAAGVTVALLEGPDGTKATARGSSPRSADEGSSPGAPRASVDLSDDPVPSGRGPTRSASPTGEPTATSASRPAHGATATPSRTAGAGTTGGGAGGGSTGGGSGGGSTPAAACTATGGGKYDCQVWRTATSYTAAGAAAGVLNAGTNYFYCRRNLGRRETYGQWTNVWWAKTDDDSGNTNVYVSDVYIRGGDNDAPVPGLPVC